MEIFSSFRQFWYILFSSKRIFIGAIIPIAIFLALFASFALLYSNTFSVVDTLFSVKKYSLIFKTGTNLETVDKTFKTIQNYSQTKEIQKVSPAKVRQELSDSFEKINQELASLQLEKFPHLIEFVLEESSASQSLLGYLEKLPSTQVIVSGLTASQQIQTLLKIVEVLGILFLILFAVSLFYIVNHAIQVSFFHFLKEIEVYLILGASNFFIYTPFLLLGFFIALKGFLIGIFISYFIFLAAVALVTFNESSFFLRDVVSFFPADLLLLSLWGFLSIGIISSFSAIYYVIKKITF